MNVFILTCVIAVAAAARLENTYLPPASAVSAGGHSGFLSAPFKQASHQSQGSFGFGDSSHVYKPTLSLPAVHQPIKLVESVYTEKSYPGHPHINILRYENINDGFGSYSYGYDTENHINAYESGQLKNVGTENEVNVVHGAYSYKGPEGIDFAVEYTADENGFQAKGAHLPTPPPIPEAILKSLELNAASASDNDDGQYREAAYHAQYLPPQKASFDRYAGYRY